ncbi:hypothetical protein MPTK2_3g18820 [Marchantia polymorpha subsp. ruderalis]
MNTLVNSGMSCTDLLFPIDFSFAVLRLGFFRFDLVTARLQTESVQKWTFRSLKHSVFPPSSNSSPITTCPPFRLRPRIPTVVSVPVPQFQSTSAMRTIVTLLPTILPNNHVFNFCTF